MGNDIVVLEDVPKIATFSIWQSLNDQEKGSHHPATEVTRQFLSLEKLMSQGK